MGTQRDDRHRRRPCRQPRPELGGDRNRGFLRRRSFRHPVQNDGGEVAIWELNGTSVIASASLGNPGPSWHAVATGDFNGDGTSDILFQNSNGEIAIWELSGGAGDGKFD